jgi:hypothetical protein
VKTIQMTIDERLLKMKEAGAAVSFAPGFDDE